MSIEQLNIWHTLKSSGTKYSVFFHPKLCIRKIWENVCTVQIVFNDVQIESQLKTECWYTDEVIHKLLKPQIIIDFTEVYDSVTELNDYSYSEHNCVPTTSHYYYY